MTESSSDSFESDEDMYQELTKQVHAIRWNSESVGFLSFLSDGGWVG